MKKAKSNVVSDFVAPVVVLVLICGVMSLLLAFTNDVTEPIIAEAEARAAEQARIEVMPAAESGGFIEVAPPEPPRSQGGEMPDSITGIYKAANGAGYVFSIITQGYGGKGTLKMTVGIGMDGTITDTKVLGHKETAGLGSKITTDAFRGQFPGKGAGLEGVDNISGATFSSNYYRAAIADAFTAFALVTGGAAPDITSGATAPAQT